MNTNKLLVSGLVGGIAIFAIGFIIYGLVLSTFFAENTMNADAIMKNPPNFILLIIGQLFFGFLLAYIFLQWAGIKTSAIINIGTATLGALIGAGADVIAKNQNKEVIVRNCMRGRGYNVVG